MKILCNMTIAKCERMRYNRMQDAGPTVTFARANQKVPPCERFRRAALFYFFNKEKEL